MDPYRKVRDVASWPRGSAPHGVCMPLPPYYPVNLFGPALTRGCRLGYSTLGSTTDGAGLGFALARRAARLTGSWGSAWGLNRHGAFPGEFERVGSLGAGLSWPSARSSAAMQGGTGDLVGFCGAGWDGLSIQPLKKCAGALEWNA